jgi:hypothetical protein
MLKLTQTMWHCAEQFFSNARVFPFISGMCSANCFLDEKYYMVKEVKTQNLEILYEAKQSYCRSHELLQWHHVWGGGCQL